MHGDEKCPLITVLQPTRGSRSPLIYSATPASAGGSATARPLLANGTLVRSAVHRRHYRERTLPAHSRRHGAFHLGQRPLDASIHRASRRIYQTRSPV